MGPSKSGTVDPFLVGFEGNEKDTVDIFWVPTVAILRQTHLTFAVARLIQTFITYCEGLLIFVLAEPRREA